MRTGFVTALVAAGIEVADTADGQKWSLANRKD